MNRSVNIKNGIMWVLRVIAAIIMLQTLFFKFTAAPESVYIFSKINMEPTGRIGIGIMELIAAILLLIPKYTRWGALLGIGLMSGALYFHITALGIVVMDDNGLLFSYALIVWTACIILSVMCSTEWTVIKNAQENATK
ncbi:MULTISPECIES: DoxX family protein [Chitinophaga]|uniref:DoxX family protein n=1 Tax=Chitinophaga TaxID=79328 RepID=UPI000BAE834E|nr:MULTISPECIES: DoxX family protein [Chitinophaga]ASZ11944.1 DoxX family protein [Chitinophaga sp. MD30]